MENVMDFEVVESYAEVIENVRRFNEDLVALEEDAAEDLAGLLGYFRAWYYIEEIHMVGPSKFIGYKNMTAARYMELETLDGRQSEQVLSRWFMPLSDITVGADFIEMLVSDLLGNHGKVPSKRSRMCAKKGWIFEPESGEVGQKQAQSVSAGPMVEVFWRAFQTLYPEDQRDLAARINKSLS